MVRSLSPLLLIVVIVPSGKFRITSPYIDVVTDSCVVLTIALSGNLLGSGNVTLTRLSLANADEVRDVTRKLKTYESVIQLGL